MHKSIEIENGRFMCGRLASKYFIEFRVFAVVIFILPFTKNICMGYKLYKFD